MELLMKLYKIFDKAQIRTYHIPTTPKSKYDQDHDVTTKNAFFGPNLAAFLNQTL